MARKIKTFAWLGNDNQVASKNGSGQCEMIGASTSRAELMRTNGMASGEMFHPSETANVQDKALAEASPGVVFARPLGSNDPDAWVPVERYAQYRERRRTITPPAWISVGAPVAVLHGGSETLATVQKIDIDEVTLDSGDQFSLMITTFGGAYPVRNAGRAFRSVHALDSEAVMSRRARRQRDDRLAPVEQALKEFRANIEPAAARVAASALLAWAAWEESEGR